MALAVAVLVALAPASPAWARPPSPSDPPPEPPAGRYPGPPAASYRPPVVAPVVDGFRRPSVPWGPGNRGIDYGASPGTSVTASADGEVVFVGHVAGSLHVVVLHADGIRTSYSFLQATAVRRGQRVRAGQPVGSAGASLHFGARAGDEYLDPTGLFAGSQPVVHLVPDHDRRPGTAAEERAGLSRLLAGAKAVGGRVLAPGAAGLEQLGEVAAATVDWWRQRGRCTPPDVAPPRPTERHLAVLVGGLGSSSENASIDDVDTSSLGFAPADVVRFSYAGGTVAESPYRPVDTGIDMRTSARRLRLLLQELAARHPGVPIDLLAHSQGGVVARAALAYEVDGLDPALPPISSLVTLGSPHEGADLGTAAALLDTTNTGRHVGGVVSTVSGGGLDPGWKSVRQLAVSSPFMERLNRQPLPQGLRFTSIAARGDLIVTAGRTRVDGAETVTVSVSGVLSDHSSLPGSPVARREVALGLAGLPPTCQGLVDSVADAVVPASLSTGESAAGIALWAGTAAVDGYATPPPRGRRKTVAGR
ncbi:MAG: peptidoglycan DD-metalloendopeptidase family protein [Acidimicrobiales bacterium]